MKKLFAILLVLVLSAGLLLTGCGNNYYSGADQWYNGGAYGDVNGDMIGNGDVVGNGNINGNVNGNISGNISTPVTQQTLTGTWKSYMTISGDFLGFMLQKAEENDEEAMAATARVMAEINTNAGMNVIMTFDGNGTLLTGNNVDDLVAMAEEFYDDFITYMRNGGFYTAMELYGLSPDETDAQLRQQGLTQDAFIDQLEERMKMLIEVLPQFVKQTENSSFDSEGNWTGKDAYLLQDSILTIAPGEENQISVRCVLVDANTIRFESVDGSANPYVGMTLQRVG